MLGSLAALLPLGLGAALRARPALPVEVIPDPGSPPDDGLWIENRNAFRESGIRCHVRVGTTHQPAVVELSVVDDLALPDLLLYWGPPHEQLDSLRGDELLLGSFFGEGSRRFELPAGASSDEGPIGRLVLYSLAHDEIIVAVALSAPGGAEWE